MKIGTVLGAVWATKKCADLHAQALLMVAVPEGHVVAADLVGAGEGEKVVVAFGSAARQCAGLAGIDCAIVGILDEGENHVDQ